MAGASGVRAKVRELAAQIQAAVGEDLVSLVLYGSALGPDYVEGRSDINFLVVVRAAPSTVLPRLRPHWPRWRRQGMAVPLVVDRHFLVRAADVFPMEIADLQVQHEVLAGDDLLASIAVQPECLRRQAEFELRSKWVRLSALYLQAEALRSDAAAALLEAVKSFCIVMRHLLRLAGKQAPQSYEQVAREFAAAFRLELPATLQLLAIRQQRASWPRDRDSLFRQYLREVEQVVDVADRLVLSGDSVG